jgi:hypothetical protein
LDGAEFFTHLSSIRRGIIEKLDDDETKVIEIFEVCVRRKRETGGGDVRLDNEW